MTTKYKWASQNIQEKNLSQQMKTLALSNDNSISSKKDTIRGLIHSVVRSVFPLHKFSLS